MKPTPIKGRPGMVSFRREPGTPLTKRERAELKALEGRPIDTSDIPEWTRGDVEAGGAGEVLSSGEEGGEPAAGCGCNRLAEEGWEGVSDAGEPGASGEDVEGDGWVGFGFRCRESVPPSRR